MTIFFDSLGLAEGQIGLAMCSSGRRPDQGGEAAEGPSDPTNGSRRSEASNSELRQPASKRRQFDDQRE